MGIGNHLIIGIDSEKLHLAIEDKDNMNIM